MQTKTSRSLRPRVLNEPVPDTRLLRRVMHAPEDMVKLVANVEAYPEFIDPISSLRVMRREQVADHHERFEADVAVAYKFVRERFRCLVNVHHDTHKIQVTKSQKSGVVEGLSNDWVFHPLSDGSTLIDFHIRVKLVGPLNMLLRDKFDRAGVKIMKRFEVRASHLCPNIGDETLDLMAECSRLGLPQSLIQQV